MKKLFLSLFLTAVSAVTFAQLPTFGIRGGANFAKLLISADGTNLSVATGSLTTYSVGVFVDFKFGNKIHDDAQDQQTQESQDRLDGHDS